MTRLGFASTWPSKPGGKQVIVAGADEPLSVIAPPGIVHSYHIVGSEVAEDSPEASCVSVVIPSYNYGHLIAETLDSVLAQTYRDWECIVVDDGSTDNTREVVGRYCLNDSRIRYIYQENRGLSGARNTGIAHSRGAYVQFLDSDDLIEPGKLASQVSYLVSHQEVDLVYSGCRYFNSDNPNDRPYSMSGHNALWMPGVSGSGIDLLTHVLRANIMLVNSPLLRRTLIDRVGLFDVSLKAVEDWDYWIRCAIAGANFQYDPDRNALAYVRCHPSSMSANKSHMARCIIRLLQKTEHALTDNQLRENLHRRISEAYFEAEWISRQEGDLKSALRFGLHTLFRCPTRLSYWKSLIGTAILLLAGKLSPSALRGA